MADNPFVTTRRSSSARYGRTSLPRGTVNLIKRVTVVLIGFVIIKLVWFNGPSSSSDNNTLNNFPGRNGSPSVPRTNPKRSGDSSTSWPFPYARTRLSRSVLPLTQVLNHAPGFTVFKDVYYRRGRFIILTDSPYSIPDIDQIAYIEARPDNVLRPIELVEVRMKPIMGYMPEYIGKDRGAITPEEALKRFDPAKVEVIPGFSVSRYHHSVSRPG
jgi:hypothetical protein